MALEITDANFDTETAAEDKVVVLDFWAQWCGPCRMVGPIIDQLSEEYKDQAIIGKVDVDNNPETSMKFGVRNLPTILFIKNGEVVDRQVGAVPKPVLEKKLQALL